MRDELRFLTLDEVTKLLPTSKATLPKVIANEAIVPVKIGSSTLFTRKEVSRCIERQKGAARHGRQQTLSTLRLMSEVMVGFSKFLSTVASLPLWVLGNGAVKRLPWTVAM